MPFGLDLLDVAILLGGFASGLIGLSDHPMFGGTRWKTAKRAGRRLRRAWRASRRAVRALLPLLLLALPLAGCETTPDDCERYARLAGSINAQIVDADGEPLHELQEALGDVLSAAEAFGCTFVLDD